MLNRASYEFSKNNIRTIKMNRYFDIKVKYENIKLSGLGQVK